MGGKELIIIVVAIVVGYWVGGKYPGLLAKVGMPS